MKYKSENIDFLTNDMKISNLCFYGEHYYFASDMEIPEAEKATDEEFAEATASIIHVDRTETPEEPTEAEIAQAEMMLTQAEILEKLNQIGG